MAQRRDRANESLTSHIPLPASQPLARPPSRSNNRRQSTFGSASLISRAPPPNARLQASTNNSAWADYGKTPMKASAGASTSTSTNRRLTQSRPARAGLPPTTVPTKEMRPVRDKAYQQKEQREVLDYLIEIEFDMTLPNLSLKTISSPTKKEFEDIWRRLVEELDPDIQWSKKLRFEEEFMQVMKDLRYPHAEQITRTQLMAVNTPHSWQAILAALHWIVQLAKAKRRLIIENCLNDPYMDPMDQLDLQSHTSEMHKILQLHFLSHAYHKWTSSNGTDEAMDFGAEEDVLIDLYRQKSASEVEASHAMKTEIDKLRAQLEQLKQRPTPLEKADQDVEKLITQRNEYSKACKLNEKKMNKTQSTVASLEAEAENKLKEVEKLQKERQEIQMAIKVQGLSQEEVAQMNTDQDVLSKTVEALSTRSKELKSSRNQLEVHLTHRIDEVEAAIATYTNLLERVGLYPDAPDPVADVDFAVDLNVAVSDPKKMTDVDIRGKIKPALLTYKTAKKQEKKRVLDTIIDYEAVLEELAADIEEARERMNVGEEKLQQIRETIDITKERHAEETETSKSAIAQLERNVRDIEEQLSNGTQGSEATLRNLQIQFQETQHKLKKVKDEIVQKIISASSTTAYFMSDTEKIMKSLEAAALASQ